MEVFLAAVYAGAQLYETEVEYNLVTSSSPDLFSCCPVETTISIYPQTPNQMLRTEQHFSILRDYYDGWVQKPSGPEVLADGQFIISSICSLLIINCFKIFSPNSTKFDNAFYYNFKKISSQKLKVESFWSGTLLKIHTGYLSYSNKDFHHKLLYKAALSWHRMIYVRSK